MLIAPGICKYCSKPVDAALAAANGNAEVFAVEQGFCSSGCFRVACGIQDERDGVATTPAPGSAEALVLELGQLDSDELATETDFLRQAISDLTEAHNERIRELVQKEKIGSQLLIDRIRAGGGRALSHQTLEIEIEQRTEIQKRIDVLRRLEAHVPADELKKAVYQETPPKPEDMPWKANATYLKPLAKKYGGIVAQIIDEGVVKVEIGAPRLVIRRREAALKNVSPLAIDAERVA